MKPLLSLSIRSAWSLALALASTTTLSAADYYSSIVQNDQPLAYYRLTDAAPLDWAANSGSLGTNGNGIYIGAGHRVTGALMTDADAAASFDGTGSRVVVPFTSALNPVAAKPFTVEAWVMPAVDGQSPAQVPLFNLHTTGNYQGWVIQQLTSGAGFELQMFNQNGSSPSVDISGGSYYVGQWTHLAVVWTGSAATLYVNGVNVGSQSGSYVANTDAPFTLGAYGTNNPGDNPFSGAIDEVAVYTNALTATQIANHYSTGQTATSAVAYSSQVLADGAVEYLRLDEPTPLANVAANRGLIGLPGDATHSPGAGHGVAGAIAGITNAAMHYSAIDTNTEDGGVPTLIPYNADLNSAGSFSVEAWLRPTLPGNSNAQSPMFNRDPIDANAPNRAGWDFFQRATTTGFNFRMFNGSGHNPVFNITGGTYTVGKWCHLVAVYNATKPSATLYVNGVQVATSSSPSGTYNPNTYSPMSIGGYSDGAQNPFVGDIDEFAYYTNALTTAQVLAHYQNGTNASRTVAYDQLVLTDGAAEYLRLDEPARAVAANEGTAGNVLNGTYVNTTNNFAGPQTPADAGFSASNAAAYFNAYNTYLELGNPTNLNFRTAITLEAWILPDGSQNATASLIAHGTNSDASGEVSLRLCDGAYQVGSIKGHATYPIPAGDLGGGNWIHLAGTWDGTNWNLFRNGVLVATLASTNGPSVVTNANWAVGARGRWKNVAGYPASGQQDVFSGGIDEVAIYNAALSPARIAAHYSAGAYGSTPLTVSQDGSGNVILNWSAGTLQSAPDAAGPYTDVSSAGSPFTVSATSGASRLFYRIRY